MRALRYKWSTTSNLLDVSQEAILTFISSLIVPILISLAVTFTEVFIAMCSDLKCSITEEVGLYTRLRLRPIYKSQKFMKLTRYTGFLPLLTQTVNNQITNEEETGPPGELFWRDSPWLSFLQVMQRALGLLLPGGVIHLCGLSDDLAAFDLSCSIIKFSPVFL